MQNLTTDPVAPVYQTGAPVYVWQSLGEPGEYALCTNPHYPSFQNANWKFLGELSDVPALASFSRVIANDRTGGGAPLIVNIVGDETFLF